MALTIKCPRCSVTHTVAEELLGKAVKCTSCKATMRLPAPPKVVTARALPKREAIVEYEVIEDEPEAPIRVRDEEDEPIRVKKKPRRRKKKKTSVIATVLVSIWFFVIVPGGVIARYLSIQQKINRINEREEAQAARNNAEPKPMPKIQVTQPTTVRGAQMVDDLRGAAKAQPSTPVKPEVVEPTIAWKELELKNIECRLTMPVHKSNPPTIPAPEQISNFELSGHDEQGVFYIFKFEVDPPNRLSSNAYRNNPVANYLTQFTTPTRNRESRALIIQGRGAVDTKSVSAKGAIHFNRIIAEFHPQLGLIAYTMTVLVDPDAQNSPNIRRYFDSFKFERAVQ